jgi:hypothetical protein
MPKQPTGIFTPFNTPSDLKKIPEENQSTTLHIMPYILTLPGSTKNIPTILGQLIAKLQLTETSALLRYGIKLIPRGDTYAVNSTETLLTTPVGHLCIDLNTETPTNTETQALIKICAALEYINKPKVLQELNIILVKKG